MNEHKLMVNNNVDNGDLIYVTNKYRGNDIKLG